MGIDHLGRTARDQLGVTGTVSECIYNIGHPGQTARGQLGSLARRASVGRPGQEAGI